MDVCDDREGELREYTLLHEGVRVVTKKRRARGRDTTTHSRSGRLSVIATSSLSASVIAKAALGRLSRAKRLHSLRLICYLCEQFT